MSTNVIVMESDAKFCLYYLGMGMIFACSLIYLENQRNYAKYELEKSLAAKGYVLQKKDLNANGKPELFYEINGKKCFVEVDGKSIEDTLK